MLGTKFLKGDFLTKAQRQEGEVLPPPGRADFTKFTGALVVAGVAGLTAAGFLAGEEIEARDCPPQQTGIELDELER